MAYDQYECCPHCWTQNVDGYEDSPGCDRCNQTGKRVLDKESIDLFASAKSYYDDLIERTFLLWVKHIKNADEDYSVSSFEISGNLIYIDARYYRGCNEYDNDSFKMPIEYILSENPEQMIKDEAARIATEKAQAEAIRQETLRQQKILDDAERQRQQDQRDREEFQRLSKKFGNND